ncbi:uncharacterized protein [Aegilops tauschii subsp. strangulata]|uniref:uncharacterized protein n=1 Tax=Aegilops tauschii subsp. strangulata TaxID=200361 RepID=UPI003CC84C91
MAPLRLLTVSARTLLLLPGIDSATLPSVAFLAYTGGWLETESESEAAAALRRMARSGECLIQSTPDDFYVMRSQIKPVLWCLHANCISQNSC